MQAYITVMHWKKTLLKVMLLLGPPLIHTATGAGDDPDDLAECGGLRRPIRIDPCDAVLIRRIQACSMPLVNKLEEKNCWTVTHSDLIGQSCNDTAWVRP